MASVASTEEQSLTCAVCLGIFNDPRFLHCHHSFCTRCIEGVASRHGGGSLPCPSCRAKTVLPPKGVTGLQRNYYILEATLERARAGAFRCTTHPKEELDLYCRECEVPVCQKCILTKHKEHDTENLSDAAARAIDQLKSRQKHLQDTKEAMDELIKWTETQQEMLQGKKNAVKQNIRARHAFIVEAANRSRDEALAIADDVTTDTERKLTQKLETHIETRDNTYQIERQLQAVIDEGSGCKLVDAASKIEASSGDSETVNETLLEGLLDISSPVLRYEAAGAEDVVKHIENYIGTPVMMDVEGKMEFKTIEVEKSNIIEQPGCEVFSMCAMMDVEGTMEFKTIEVEKSNIVEQPGCEVFSMCVNDNDEVYMSYAWKENSGNATSEKFGADGTLRMKVTEARGKISWRSRGNESVRHLNYLSGGTRRTFSKSSLWLLHSDTSGTAKVIKTTGVSNNPCEVEDCTEFTIQCGPHRAFDVDSTGTLFAVVEELKDTNTHRKVRMFEKRGTWRPAMDIRYKPSTQPFMPSDICFFTPNNSDTEALLVADEVNDAIHVVDVRRGKAEFLHYLCPGHPQLIQPTALTVDSRNRLWVACRGRIVFIVRVQCSVFLQKLRRCTLI